MAVFVKQKVDHKSIIWNRYLVSTPENFKEWLSGYVANLSRKEVKQLSLDIAALKLTVGLFP